jgi:hypothetical protein
MVAAAGRADRQPNAPAPGISSCCRDRADGQRRRHTPTLHGAYTIDISMLRRQPIGSPQARPQRHATKRHSVMRRGSVSALSPPTSMSRDRARAPSVDASNAAKKAARLSVG